MKDIRNEISKIKPNATKLAKRCGIVAEFFSLRIGQKTIFFDTFMSDKSLFIMSPRF